MKLNELFLAELERDAVITRRTLERVPEGRNDWKPHAKSMPLGYLASLVASMPGWIAMMIDLDGFDMAVASQTEFHPRVVETNQELVEIHEKAVAKARESLLRTNDEHLMTNWKFLVNGHVATDLPRHISIRDAVFSHLAHHRGQLTVYLRLNEAMVPALFGPSADERNF